MTYPVMTFRLVMLRVEDISDHSSSTLHSSGSKYSKSISKLSSSSENAGGGNVSASKDDDSEANEKSLKSAPKAVTMKASTILSSVFGGGSSTTATFMQGSRKVHGLDNSFGKTTLVIYGF
jgi:hypothetical protein